MLKNKDCEICAFENPKLTATAIVIQDGKVLVVKRNEKPFQGKWDFVGGYLQKNETPEKALARELKEELNVDIESSYIGSFTGSASHNGMKFPILSFAYLVKIKGKIKLNNENSEYRFIDIEELNTIAFDSNIKILKYLKDKFQDNLNDVKSLIKQLDSSAQFREQEFYQAQLDGHVSKIYEGKKLVGMGWIFVRQTMLRKQAVVEDMIVDESQRGKGYGYKLLDNIVKWAGKNGVEVVELTTNPKRIAANNLYQKYGFKLHPTNHYLYKI